MVYIGYCCKFPRQSLFLDWNSVETAVVYCNNCQKVAAEIFIEGDYKGKNVLGEEE